MRRCVYLLLLALFVSASASCVSASTDCERWYATYRQELAHSRQVQRIAAARRRAKLYAQRKIAQVQPKPRLVPARSPRMTRKQTLHRIDLACGVLPEGGGDEPLVSEETPSPFTAERPMNDGIDLLPAAPGELIAENDAPPFEAFSSTSSSSTENGPSPYFPGFSGPGGGAPASSSTATGVTVPPTTLSPAAPPVSVVPEPASFVYLLTGLAGAAGAIRRRFKA